ncbi:class I SAM-dependent methyltransferase [bacterium]|nr:class I SAM-dependent methyltransferase [bacterium]
MSEKISKIRNFYETEYHYEEDVRAFDIKRVKRYFRLFNPPDNGNILDIGCGSGLNLKYWSKQNFQLYGIDLSHRALKLALNKVVPRASFTVADGQNLPFDDETFDIITALGVIEHFPEPKKGFEEVYRLLKPDGKACIVLPNSFGSLGEIIGFHGTEQEQELMLTLDEWKILLQSTGLEVKKVLRDRGPKIFKNWKIHKIIARFLLRLTLFLPKKYAYVFIFHIEKNGNKGSSHSNSISAQ